MHLNCLHDIWKAVLSSAKNKKCIQEIMANKEATLTAHPHIPAHTYHRTQNTTNKHCTKHETSTNSSIPR